MKLPRKLKKAILGERLSYGKIQSLIRAMEVIPAKGAESTIVNPFPFCPCCGCGAVRWSGNRVAYPERWESGYCMRCSYLVWECENSPYYHCLEYEDHSIR